MRGALLRVGLAAGLVLPLGCCGCDGFTAHEEGGWWCQWDSTSHTYNSMNCDVAWDCENHEAVHLGAKDDPDPMLRIHSYRVSCSTLMEGGVDKGYSCACYEGERHISTFLDQDLCLVAMEGDEGWFRDVVGRAKESCGWAPLPQ
jgi:hypothetical protein